MIKEISNVTEHPYKSSKTGGKQEWDSPFLITIIKIGLTYL
jgi:hypothetical protein